MKRPKKWTTIVMIASILITVIGIVTGKFVFLFLLLPLGWFNFFKKDNEE